MEDRTLMEQLQQRSTSGNLVQAVSLDPRDKSFTITYSASNADEAKKAGFKAAKEPAAATAKAPAKK